MSYKLTAQVVETFNQNLTAVEKLVLAVLASFADKLGRNVFPSLTEVARRGCCSKRAVERAMARLRVLGVLHYDERGKGRKGRTRRYRFNIERAEALFVAGAVSPDTQSEGNDRETEEGTDKTTEVADNETVCAAKLSGVPPRRGGEPSNYPVNEPCAPADACDGEAAPANAHWNAHHGAMVEVFGKQAVTAWLDPLIVGKDDGTEIELWCPTQLFVDTVDSEFRPKIEEILDRKIKGIVRNLKALEVTRRADQIRSER